MTVSDHLREIKLLRAVFVMLALALGLLVVAAAGPVAGEAPAGGGPAVALASIGSDASEDEFATVNGKRKRTFLRRFEFGRSVGGRPLIVFRVGDSDAKRKVLVFGSIHGDERQGERIAKRLRTKYRKAKDVEYWVVPTVNPDGVAAGTRKNRRGVDLNRNFGYRWSGNEPPGSGYYGGTGPFSEPESRAVRKLIRRVKPKVTAWYHQPWGAVLVPCAGKAPIQREYARLVSMPTSCQGAGLPGTAISWQNHNFGGTAFVIELPARNLTSAEVNRHARALTRIARP